MLFAGLHARTTKMSTLLLQSALLAEWVGFEPTVPLPVHLISSQVTKTELGGI